MRHSSLSAFLSVAPTQLSPKGPFALVFIEDDAEVESTIAHVQKMGFRDVLAFAAGDLLPNDREGLHLIETNVHELDAFATITTEVIKLFPDVWMHYCFNAEYMFFPFCETRNVRELIAFNIEERRHTVMTYVVDLYSKDLGKHPNAVSLEQAYLDKSGYYALARFTEDGKPLERQLDFFGGLRWRFEEHIPWARRRIDRVGLFHAVKGLQLRGDHTFNLEEYNTYCCPWHHNISATICSFRTAKALVSNPGSMYAIPHFWWKNSAKFEWNSNQLLELGLMEPGQWF
ncbi:hypothetical protein BCF46_1796 [Litoreibacter meonggei]|uniref:Glycosyl transferase family 2 n=1 Tax=Litoreibacter meonggei TaxID=1049199 RepID=A0A497W6N1_9RHOB|nr:hypothetical protein [Litoreibacter meonggei]RLJ51582.1 hypothetical protein BCF46_1796 [Litoreibacter meonggei]